MTLDGKSDAVIGAGIGGLASALALARKGARVTVFEQAAELGEVGAGLQISANGIRVLQALGLDPLAGNRGNMPAGVEIRDYASGRRIAAVGLNQSATEPFIQYHRADLLRLLAEACSRSGVEIRLNTSAVVEDCDRASVVSDCGSISHRGFDVVIGADGVRSRTRRDHLMGDEPVFSGQIAWRALVPVADISAGADVGTRLYLGSGRHLVMYPLRDRSLVNIVAVEERDAWQAEGWNQQDDPANLRRAFGGGCSFVGDVLGRVENPLLWGLFAHPVLPQWSRGRVVLLGDAAHPMLPFMAQGACMALEDAWMLAEALDQEADTEAALKSYEARRKPRATCVQAVSRGNAGIYHAANPVKRAGLHLGMRMTNALAPQMLSRRFDWIYGYDVTAEF